MSMNDYITTNIPCKLSVPDTTENFRLILWSLDKKQISLITKPIQARASFCELD